MGDTQRRRIEEIALREIAVILVLMAVAVVQSAILIRPLGLTINVLLLLTICYTLLGGVGRAARWAFYGGLWLDLCSFGPIGLHPLALLGAAMAVGTLFGSFSRSNWLVPLGAALAGSVIYTLILGALTHALVAPLDVQHYIVAAALPDLVTTLIPALPLYLLMRIWMQARRSENHTDVL